MASLHRTFKYLFGTSCVLLLLFPLWFIRILELMISSVNFWSYTVFFKRNYIYSQYIDRSASYARRLCGILLIPLSLIRFNSLFNYVMWWVDVNSFNILQHHCSIAFRKCDMEDMNSRLHHYNSNSITNLFMPWAIIIKPLVALIPIP